MYILGINSAYHESAACLLRDGEIVAAVEEERFTRKKHAKRAQIDNPDELPVNAIGYCLAKAGIGMSQVAHVGYSLNPQKRLENKNFVDGVVENDWGSASGEEEFHRRVNLVPGGFEAMGFAGKFTFIDHHLCHLASAYYVSPFDEAAVISVDGIGETSSTAFAAGEGPRLRMLQNIVYPASLGFFWEKISKFLGFSEYDSCKIMSLAAYDSPEKFMGQFDRLIELSPNGHFHLDNSLLRFRVEDYTGLEGLFGVPRRERGQQLRPEHFQIAASLQEITNRAMLHMAHYAHELTGSRNLCMAGGVALNCVANRIIHEQSPFENLYIQPAANDAGTAVGAAQVIWNSMLRNERRDKMRHAYLGPSFSEEEMERELKASGLSYERVEETEALVARLLSEGHVVGWFQGAMEFGPRGLGNRSLLADPRQAGMREILNARVKHREEFRPFAPSVLNEEAGAWFDIHKATDASDFMLMAYKAREDVRHLIPAVLHVDGTSRVQTVKREENPKYHRLISEFFKLTGVPLVLNTSFNDNEPVVCTPRHAIDTFLKTRIDYLVLGDFIVDRKRQAGLNGNGAAPAAAELRRGRGATKPEGDS